MEENNSTEVTEVIESGEQAEVVDQQEERNSDFDMVEVTDDSHDDAVDHHETESGDEETESDKTDIAEGETEKADKEKQSRLDNQAARLARLKAERDARKAVTEEADRRIRESGAINPYTEKPFQSLKEFEEYGKRVKAAESGEEYHETPEEPKNTAEDFFKDDLINFMESHPGVDVEALDNNPNFRKFCGTRYGREPLSNLYDDYVSLVSTAEKVGKAKDTRAERSTGSGAAGGAVLSPAQRAALNDWNRHNPDMKMTAKEFLSR